MHLNAKDLLDTGIFKEGLTLLCGTKSPQYSFLVGYEPLRISNTQSKGACKQISYLIQLTG